MGLMFWKSDAVKKVLAVDDSVLILKALEKQLKELGYEVHLAKNGAEALTLAEAQLPGVILLDINMPGMSGIDTLIALKKNPKTATIPVLMCTAEQKGTEVERAFQSGAAGYLIKPFDSIRLKGKIDQILTGQPEQPQK